MKRNQIEHMLSNWHIYMLVGFVTLAIVVTMAYSLWMASHTAVKYEALIDASTMIRFKTTQAHLWLEEIITGDKHEKIETVWRLLDKSDWYATAMLEGGIDEIESFIRLTDPKLCEQVKALQTTQAQLRVLFEQRYASIEESSIGSDADQHFDAFFMDFLVQAEDVGVSLRKLMTRHLANFRSIQIMLILVVVTLSLLVSVILHILSRQRIMDSSEIIESNVNLKKEVCERQRAEDRLNKINACLSNLGSDFAVNVNRITTLLGELLGATCALYNRLDHGMLCSLGQWHAPPDFTPQDKPNGHICYDVIQGSNEGVCIIHDLQSSPYAQSDPNVVANNLKTYVGQVVRCNGEPVGSLCAVFQKNVNPSEDEKRIIGILTSALRGEEERRQAEERLKTHRYYLEKAQEIGSIGTWELDLHENVLKWTDENYRIFGVPLGTALTYEIFLDCIYPKDRDYVHEQWSAALNHGPYDIEHRLIVDGTIKWVREKADVAFDENGNAVKAIGFTQDITERKLAEKNLRDSEKKNRALPVNE